jgi:leucine dehydrogenase
MTDTPTTQAPAGLAITAVDVPSHERVVRVTDPESGLHALIAIHNQSRGPAPGGIRFWPYANEAEALNDVLRLSRGMTAKSRALDLPWGGAKTVIIGDPSTLKSPALLRALAHAINRLDGRYIGGEDVNISVADIETMRAITPHLVGSANGCGDPAPFTAQGVFHGIRAAVAERLERDTLCGLKFAVQGAGAVSSILCELLHREGADISVCDLNEMRAKQIAERTGGRVVPVQDIMEIEADVLVPCALGGILNAHSIARLTVPVVAGPANNQLALPEDAARLHARGILYAPDYLINAGGLIAGIAEYEASRDGHNFDRTTTMAKVDLIYARSAALFAEADKRDLPPATLCDQQIAARIDPQPA